MKLPDPVICDRCDYGHIIRGECTNPLCDKSRPTFCKWKFMPTGYLFGSATGLMSTECGHSWSELVDYKRLTYCPYCGKEIAE